MNKFFITALFCSFMITACSSDGDNRPDDISTPVDNVNASLPLFDESDLVAPAELQGVYNVTRVVQANGDETLTSASVIINDENWTDTIDFQNHMRRILLS